MGKRRKQKNVDWKTPKNRLKNENRGKKRFWLGSKLVLIEGNLRTILVTFGVTELDLDLVNFFVFEDSVRD